MLADTLTPSWISEKGDNGNGKFHDQGMFPDWDLDSWPIRHLDRALATLTILKLSSVSGELHCSQTQFICGIGPWALQLSNTIPTGLLRPYRSVVEPSRIQTDQFIWNLLLFYIRSLALLATSLTQCEVSDHTTPLSRLIWVISGCTSLEVYFFDLPDSSLVDRSTNIHVVKKREKTTITATTRAVLDLI